MVTLDLTISSPSSSASSSFAKGVPGSAIEEIPSSSTPRARSSHGSGVAVTFFSMAQLWYMAWFQHYQRRFLIPIEHRWMQRYHNVQPHVLPSGGFVLSSREFQACKQGVHTGLGGVKILDWNMLTSLAGGEVNGLAASEFHSSTTWNQSVEGEPTVREMEAQRAKCLCFARHYISIAICRGLCAGEYRSM